jgi:hypothetical protein
MTVSKNKFLFFLISILFSLSILLWTLTEYFPDLFFFALVFPWIIIPLNIGFVVTLIISVSNWIRKGFKESKIGLIIHGLVILLIGIAVLIQSELFKSEIVLKAKLIDDLNRIALILSENKEFEMTSTGMYFYQETKTGKYKLENYTLIFSNPPYDNDFIPLKVLSLPDKNRIYFKRKQSGEIDATDVFAQFFEIEFNKLTVK